MIAIRYSFPSETHPGWYDQSRPLNIVRRRRRMLAQIADSTTVPIGEVQRAMILIG
jgi:hypothetical protein